MYNFKKINVYLKTKKWYEYIHSTNAHKTCKSAKEKASEIYLIDIKKLSANFA